MAVPAAAGKPGLFTDAETEPRHVGRFQPRQSHGRPRSRPSRASAPQASYLGVDLRRGQDGIDVAIVVVSGETHRLRESVLTRVAPALGWRWPPGWLSISRRERVETTGGSRR